MLSNLYITFTMFYCNTISLKRTQEEKLPFFGSVSGCTCLILTISVSRKKIYNQQLGSYEKKTILDEVVFILFLCYITGTCRHTIVFYGKIASQTSKRHLSACNIRTFYRRFSRNLTPKNTLR